MNDSADSFPFSWSTMTNGKVIHNTVTISKAEMEATRDAGPEAFARYCTDEYMMFIKEGLEALKPKVAHSLDIMREIRDEHA